MKEIKEIKLSSIDAKINANDYQDESLLILAQKLKEGASVQSLVLKLVDGHYEILDGERVYKAALINNQESIEATIVDSKDANLMLMEKIKRSSNDVIEEALNLERLLKEEGITQSALAKRLGLRQSTIANKLRLLKLPDYVKEALSQNVLTERHARALLKVEEAKLKEVFDTIVERKYNVKKTEEYIKALDKRGNRGVSNNVQIGINTIKQAFELCKKSGLDCELSSRELDDEVKIMIRFKK